MLGTVISIIISLEVFHTSLKEEARSCTICTDIARLVDCRLYFT